MDSSDSHVAVENATANVEHFSISDDTSLECMHVDVWANKSHVCQSISMSRRTCVHRRVDCERVFMLLAKTRRYYLTNVPNYDTSTRAPIDEFQQFCTQDNTFEIYCSYICLEIQNRRNLFEIHLKPDWSHSLSIRDYSGIQKPFDLRMQPSKEFPVNWHDVNQKYSHKHCYELRSDLISSNALHICHI